MLVEVSPGEVVDKLTILAIKLDRIKDEEKLTNINREYNSLLTSFSQIESSAVWSSNDVRGQIAALWDELRAVNEIIWDIEDTVRDCERQKVFDEKFITAARGVYQNNDKRAELKREINVLLASQIIEEKSYTKYT